MGLDHVMLKVKDWQKAKEFYTPVLKPLGYEPVADWGTGGGYGVPGEKIGFIFVLQGALRRFRRSIHTMADYLQVTAEAPSGPDTCPSHPLPCRRQSYTSARGPGCSNGESSAGVSRNCNQSWWQGQRRTRPSRPYTQWPCLLCG